LFNEFIWLCEQGDRTVDVESIVFEFSEMKHSVITYVIPDVVFRLRLQSNLSISNGEWIDYSEDEGDKILQNAGTIYQVTQNRIPADSYPHQLNCENLNCATFVLQ
jgi:phage pi2 protein 07